MKQDNIQNNKHFYDRFKCQKLDHQHLKQTSLRWMFHMWFWHLGPLLVIPSRSLLYTPSARMCAWLGASPTPSGERREKRKKMLEKRARRGRLLLLYCVVEEELSRCVAASADERKRWVLMLALNDPETQPRSQEEACARTHTLTHTPVEFLSDSASCELWYYACGCSPPPVIQLNPSLLKSYQTPFNHRLI